MHQKELENVFKLEPRKRYEYFIKKVADFEEVWGLRQGDGWASTGDENAREYIAFWPKKEFADLCAKEEWQNYYAESIQLEEFIEQWLTGMGEDKVMASIFPNFLDNSVIVEPKQLLEHLNQELELYE